MNRSSLVDEFEINSGKLFTTLLQGWRKYNYQFLVNNVQNSFVETLTKKNILTLESSRRNRKRIQELFEESFSNYNDKYGINKPLPFPPFHFPRSKSTFPYNYVEFSESCIIDRQDEHFDLFFSLHVTLSKPSEIDSFLSFHLRSSFKNNSVIYVSFLNGICFKYPKLLTREFASIIETYISSFAANDSYRNTNRKKTSKELTLMQKVLFFHLLFDAFNVYQNTSKVEVARVIQLLIEKETHHNIYKFLNEIVHNDKGASKKDLVFVKEIFDRLDIQPLVNKIWKEIEKIDKKR